MKDRPGQDPEGFRWPGYVGGVLHTTHAVAAGSNQHGA